MEGIRHTSWPYFHRPGRKAKEKQKLPVHSTITPKKLFANDNERTPEAKSTADGKQPHYPKVDLTKFVNKDGPQRSETLPGEDEENKEYEEKEEEEKYEEEEEKQQNEQVTAKVIKKEPTTQAERDKIAEADERWRREKWALKHAMQECASRRPFNVTGDDEDDHDDYDEFPFELAAKADKQRALCLEDKAASPEPGATKSKQTDPEKTNKAKRATKQPESEKKRKSKDTGDVEKKKPPTTRVRGKTHDVD